jgi:regulator of protease activity HflC (stomatin/prohibitin superfamily)
MLGLEFIKVDPTIYLLQYKMGQLIREGTGLSFFYFAPTTSLVAVPVGSTDIPFIFREVTADFQDVTIQGQVVFRVADPVRLSQMLNFTLDATNQKYVSEDPVKFPQRIINQVQVLIRDELQTMSLRTVLMSSDNLVRKVKQLADS